MAETATKTVLTEEEVKNLTSLQQQQNELIFALGQTNYQFDFLEKQKKEIYKQLEALEGKQTEAAQGIEKKYGKGTVSLDTGEFIKA